ncbi:hypothetical protein TWF718_007759 [Orbilia javanica]|uniref:Peptidase M20 dimerisation domain-containing protein n=1 Tax=Orbilia javanica TaxID=47235 RepID=A0AAN8RMH7_9PEZI
MGNPEVLLPKDSKDLPGSKSYQSHIFRNERYRKYLLNFLGLLGIALLGAAFYQSYAPHINIVTPKVYICNEQHGSRPYQTSQVQKKPALKNVQELCPLVEPIYPETNSLVLRRALARLRSPDYLFWSAKALGDAVRVRTQVYDDLGDVYEDPRWNVMDGFNRYLDWTFPLLRRYLRVETVNRYGRVYTWEGSDRSLKPVLLLAHQDVVPVEQETLNEWEYPPYSGDFRDGFIWGRGALDDKNQLVGIMESLSLLLQSGFRPARTIVVGFGFDEEIGGNQGAQHIADHLLRTYGKDSFALLIDEGSSMQEVFGSNIMAISTAEKGFMNQRITIKTPGGHSSVPPKHSSIGILSELIVALESHPFEHELSDDNPLYDFLTCSAAHAKDFPEDMYNYIAEDDREALIEALVKYNPRYDVDLRSTVAVDTICGGTKVNALPEFVTAEVNHRIRRGSSISEVTNATLALASEIAEKHGLKLIAYPERKIPYPESSITLETFNGREPSPLTSSRTDIPTAYKLIAGTTRAVFGEDLVVTASLNMGNTDTFWYTGLSENIFRYAPMPVVKKNMHGVNERVPMDGHLAMVEWFFTFLLNADDVDRVWLP